MGLIEYVAALLLAVGIAWLLANIGRYRSGPIDWLSEGFAWLVRGWRDDPWPHGVQEEDRDRPWGRATVGEPAEPADPPAPIPTLTPLRPNIRSR